MHILNKYVGKTKEITMTHRARSCIGRKLKKNEMSIITDFAPSVGKTGHDESNKKDETEYEKPI